MLGTVTTTELAIQDGTLVYEITTTEDSDGTVMTWVHGN